MSFGTKLLLSIPPGIVAAIGLGFIVKSEWGLEAGIGWGLLVAPFAIALFLAVVDVHSPMPPRDLP